MSRIIFLNRFFFPDHSASSQLLSDLAFYLAEHGQDVHVVTSQQIYDAPSVRLPKYELLSGVHIHRVSATRFGRRNLLGRSIDYLSFYLSMWRRVVSFAQPGDILIAKTDPPLLSVLAAPLAKRHGMHLVNWLQDIYPEIAIELGFRFLKGPIGSALAALRNHSLKAAYVNVVLGTSMADRLRKLGIPESKICVITNWANDEEVVPIPANENPLRREWSLEGKFIVGYSGNLGRAHEFETLLAAAELLRDDPRIIFIFFGGGKQFDALIQAVHQRKLDAAFRFFPYQDRSILKYSLSVPDAHWLSLLPQLEGLIFPSKLYGIAAAGRPMIAVMDPHGEIANLIHQHECGFSVAPGNAAELSRVISLLANDASLCREMGRRSRAVLEEQFTRKQSLMHWLTLVEKIRSRR